MAENVLNVEVRERSGKGVARKLRAAGRIPGVCYGRGESTVAVALDARELRNLIEKSESGINTVFSLRGDGGLAGRMVLVRELQRDPVKGHYLHADLYAVDLEKTVQVSVPIHLTGRARGVEQEGGILDHALREVELECLPLAIPREIEVDVTALDLGESLHVSDLALPEGVELVTDGELAVVSVVAPSRAEEEPAAEEAEALEAAAVEGAEKPEEAPAEGEAEPSSE